MVHVTMRAPEVAILGGCLSETEKESLRLSEAKAAFFHQLVDPGWV